MNNPTPPWERNVQSPVTQTLYEAGAISLITDTTYLESTSETDLECTLPDGNYPQQRKQIYVPTELKDTTANWRITGTFVGFSSLLFSTIGWSALLEWDGAGWHLIGGNANPESV